MGTHQFSRSHADHDDDYIDIEMCSSPNVFCYSISSPPQTREFEFQMCSFPVDKETTTSPADELFYKGQLLPLHLPPRLQMVQKLLQNPSTTSFNNTAHHSFQLNYSAPLESCSISPSESCMVTSEVDPDDYFFELSSQLNSFIGYHPLKKSWTKKLKKFLLGQKLKASSAYLKSLFTKSGCADESSFTKAASKRRAEPAESKGKDFFDDLKYMKVPKKNPFGEFDNQRFKLSNTLKMKNIDKEMSAAERFGYHTQRRSFSGAIQRYSTSTKSLSSSSTSSSGSSSSSSSSSSFSFSSSNGGFYDLQLLKRSISTNREIENSIEGAIAYCNKSYQQLLYSRNTAAAEVGACSFSASELVAYGDKERPKLCSI